ncbi:MAG: cytochrome b [Gammaproteobacteria bacterium]|nr:cytochrome b [Gammaproteobacteria bacterium]
MTIKDNQERYGTISRVLHWSMALLVLWQFLSAGSHYFLEDTAIEAFFWPTHKPLGVLLLVLIAIRMIWALAHLTKRPSSISLFVKIGHIGLYLLLLAVPMIALIRQYGSGRSFEVFGIPVFAGFEGEKIKWMLDLGKNWHSELGWVLLALIIGHIIMVLWHKRSKDKNVLPRMWG